MILVIVYLSSGHWDGVTGTGTPLQLPVAYPPTDRPTYLPDYLHYATLHYILLSSHISFHHHHHPRHHLINYHHYSRITPRTWDITDRNSRRFISISLPHIDTAAGQAVFVSVLTFTHYRRTPGTETWIEPQSELSYLNRPPPPG